MATLNYLDPKTGEYKKVVVPGGGGGVDIPASDTPPEKGNWWLNTDGNPVLNYRKDENSPWEVVGVTDDPESGAVIAEHNQDTGAHGDIRQLMANKKGAQVFEAVIDTNWTEDSDTGVKYQTVSIDGVTADNTAKVDHSSASIDGTSDGYAVFVEEENQYLTYVTNGFAETVEGGIKFTIFGDAPTVNIPIVVEVV